MALLQTLRSFVNERLCAAADEIFVVVERIITEYEDEAFSSKQQQLQQRILEVVLKHPDVGFRTTDVLPEQKERSPSLIQEEEPESSPVKEEQEELLLIPEEADGSTVTLTLAAVKHEDDDDDNDDENSETEPLASTSTEHMKTQTDAEDRGSSQTICGVQLLSSHWSESRMEDSDDGEETKEAQSTLTLLDGKAWGDSISDSLHLPLCKEEVSPERQERNPSLVVQEEQELLQIKEEHGGLLQRPREADGSLMAVRIDDGDANGETGPLSSTLTEHMNTQAGVEDLPAHCYEFHTENGDDWEETSNALKPQKSHNAQRVEGQTLSSGDRLSQNLEWSKPTLSARSHTGGNGHERTNAGGTPFSCKVCQKHFSLNGHLKRHMESHTGLKPFSCTVCGKDFAQKNNLTRHIITHTYLPYSCIVCCKSYGLKSQLKTHMQTHSAKPPKPFICAFCGKCFGQSYALKRHTLIHTGEKPFSCSVCGKCFGLKHDLKRHMGIHRR